MLIRSFRGTLRVVIPTREGVTMRAVYPAWAYVVPNAPYRRITLLVLVAASIGAENLPRSKQLSKIGQRTCRDQRSSRCRSQFQI